MKRDYTHITVILDRTGSMESIRDDTIGGFNAFLKDQQAEQGKATFTLIQFDSQDSHEVIHKFMPIGEVPALTRETYVPRATTPLLDAMGMGINELEENLSAIEEDERPAKVLLVTVTDGMENASREFTRDQVKKMIKDKTKNSSWEFVFLSADLDAMGDAMSLGIHSEKALLYRKNSMGSDSAWASISGVTSAYRRSLKEKVGFKDEDRKHPDDPGKKKKKK
jgi:hypothetical protein